MEGWPQSLVKAGTQLSPIWPQPEALLPAIALYSAPSKEECEVRPKMHLLHNQRATAHFINMPQCQETIAECSRMGRTHA